MYVLKNELFMLVKRNKEIEIELHKFPTSEHAHHELQKEYEHNVKCIKIIKDMAGPIILADWRKEWLSKKGTI